MKLINQSYEICNQTDFSMSGIYKHIEKCTRVAYKSEDKITEDSANKFIKMLLNLEHFAPLELGTLHFRIPTTLLKTLIDDLVFHKLWNNIWIQYKLVNQDLLLCGHSVYKIDKYLVFHFSFVFSTRPNR